MLIVFLSFRILNEMKLNFVPEIEMRDIIID